MLRSPCELSIRVNLTGRELHVSEDLTVGMLVEQVITNQIPTCLLHTWGRRVGIGVQSVGNHLRMVGGCCTPIKSWTEVSALLGDYGP